MTDSLTKRLDLSKLENPPKLVPGGDIKLPEIVGNVPLRRNGAYTVCDGDDSPQYRATVIGTNKTGFYPRIGKEI